MRHEERRHGALLKALTERIVEVYSNCPLIHTKTAFQSMDGCFFFCEVVVWCLTVATSFEVFVKAPPQNNSKARKGDPKHLFGGKELLSVLASLGWIKPFKVYENF